MPPAADVPPEAAGGLRDAAHRVVTSLLDIGRTRLELAAVELEEERLRVARLALQAALTLGLLLVALGLAAAWLVLWCEPAQRLAALGALAGTFFVGAGLAAWRWQRLAQRRLPLLDATLAELRADREALRAGRGTS